MFPLHFEKQNLRPFASSVPLLLQVWSAVTRMESKNDLHKVKCPTLLLIGDHDNMTNYQQPYMHKHIPNSKMKIIANAHHGTNLDNPKAVNQAIFEFINKIN